MLQRQGDQKALEILGRHGARFDKAADTLGRNVLTHIVAEGKTELLPTAMKYTKRNALDPSGRSPLHYADYAADTVITTLITAGENPDIGDTLGNTPMHLISSVRAAKALHEAGADINATNRCGVPALFYQVGNGNGRMYQFLTNAGAKMDTTDHYGQSILTYALMSSNELLHRQVSDNYCEFFPQKCEYMQQKLKSSAVKAITTVLYTKTLHKAALRRLAATEAAKGAMKRSLLRGGLKRGFLRIVPLVGWAMTAYDVVKLGEAMAKYDESIRRHREEANRLREERKIAQRLLREEYLYCASAAQNASK